MLELTHGQLNLIVLVALLIGATLARWFPVWLGRRFRRHFQPVRYNQLHPQIIEVILEEQPWASAACATACINTVWSRRIACSVMASVRFVIGWYGKRRAEE